MPVIDAPREVVCRAALTRIRVSGPTLFVRPQLLDAWGLEPQALIAVRGRSGTVTGWLRSTAEFPGGEWRTAAGPGPDLWISRRAWTSLDPGRDGAVTVRLPARARLRVGSARIDDLPHGCEVDVAPAVAAGLGAGTGWALLVRGSRAMPVALRVREMPEGSIRLSMLTRSLMGITFHVPGSPGRRRGRPLRFPAPSGNVLLAALPPERPWLERMLAPGMPEARFSRVASLGRGVARLTMRAMELLLRPALGAPRFAFRTTEALIGDDVHPVVRLPPSSFPMVGIRPGDQVILTWARRRCVAIALERVPVTTAASRDLRTHQMVDVSANTARGREDHLDVEVAASLRHMLGIPRATVLQVQRRLWTQLAVRLNGLLIPVGGLLLAAAAIQGFRPLWVWLGMAAIAAFEILHLRLPSPPRGRWR